MVDLVRENAAGADVSVLHADVLQFLAQCTDEFDAASTNARNPLHSDRMEGGGYWASESCHPNYVSW